MTDTTKAEFKKVVLRKLERLLEPDGDIAINSKYSCVSPTEEMHYEQAIRELRMEFERRSQ